MADDANSTRTSAVHELSGSTPPGAGRPGFTPTSKPRPHPRREPPAATDFSTIASRLAPLIRRENDIQRRLEMLELHHLLPEERTRLDRVAARMSNRIDRWTRQLLAIKPADARTAAIKADAYIELVTAGWTGGTEELGEQLALSVARDAVRLGIESTMIREPDATDVSVLAHRERPATVSTLADLDIEPWDPDDFQPHTNEEWSALANPHLVTSRMAWLVCLKTKAELMKMARGMPAEGTASPDDFETRLRDTADFFRVYAGLLDTAWTRFAIACATIAREDGEPEAQPGYAKPEPVEPDRRAVAAYREWLHMEGRLLGMEMWPAAGHDADRFVPANTAAGNYHFPSGTGVSWRDLPQPSTRAEAMCRVLGIDWTTDGVRDENFMPVAPAAAATEAA